MGTPLCLDQLGWTQDETVLRFGSLMAGCGVMCIIIFVSIGPICKRYHVKKNLAILFTNCKNAKFVSFKGKMSEAAFSLLGI